MHLQLRKIAGVAAICIGMLAVAQPVDAATIIYSSRAAFDAAHPGAVFETWDGYAASTVIPDGSTLNTVTYSVSGTASAIVTDNFLASTGVNGLGSTSGEFFAPGQTVTFSFATPLTAFGIDINTFETLNGTYVATTNTGIVAGSFFDPFPGFSTGQFVGFFSDTPFNTVSISGTTLTFTLDTMRVAEVPEPATLLLLGGGLASLAARRRRSRQ